MAVATVVSVRTGRVQPLPTPGWDRLPEPTWRTAYLKDEVGGPARVTRLGLEGDEQADREAHGGPEMAVLAYAAAHYPTWRSEPGLSAMGPGGFGENLTVDGLDEGAVAIGDVWRVGGCTLQVASPRGPCMAISRRWDDAHLLKRVSERLWTGWYLRVLEPGTLSAGDEVEVLERPQPEWTVRRVLAQRLHTPRDANALQVLSGLAHMSPEWHRHFAKLLAAHRG